MEKGKIKELIIEHGYGLIRVAKGPDVIFNGRSCLGMAIDSLHKGQQVVFDLDPKSRPGVLRARNVRVAATK